MAQAQLHQQYSTAYKCNRAAPEVRAASCTVQSGTVAAPTLLRPPCTPEHGGQRVPTRGS